MFSAARCHYGIYSVICPSEAAVFVKSKIFFATLVVEPSKCSHCVPVL